MSTTYNILSGTSSDYNSIWADANANINTGKFYVATTGSGAALSVVDLQLKTLADSYTLYNMGINKEFLNSEDIVDINVSIMGV
jgi:hypothetical protein